MDMLADLALWLLSPFSISDHPLRSLLLIYCAVFLGGFSRGLTGFGFPLVVVSLLVLFLPPIVVVPVVMITGTLSTLADFPRSYSGSDKGFLMPLVLGATVMTPVGVLALTWLSADLMRVCIGVAVLAAVFSLLLGFTFKKRVSWRGIFGAGLLSGLMHGAVTMGGPPAVFMTLAMRMSPDMARNTLIAHYSFIGIAALGVLGFAGLLSWPALFLSLPLFPIAVLASEIGRWVSVRTKGIGFRTISMVLLFLMASATMWRGVSGLLGL